MKGVSVHMLFGSTIINLRTVFGPPVTEPHHRTHRVVAVRIAGGNAYHSAVAPGASGHVPVCNHFVIGVAPRSLVDVDVSVATGHRRQSTCALRAWVGP